MKKSTMLVSIALFTTLGIANAYAADQTPSKEAYDACSALRDGESCKFKENNVTVSGTCKKDQSGKPVCVAH